MKNLLMIFALMFSLSVVHADSEVSQPDCSAINDQVKVIAADSAVEGASVTEEGTQDSIDGQL